jgi:hypothetical protein
VRQLDDSVLTIEIAPEVRVRLDRRAVAAIVRADEVEEPAEPTQAEAGES